MRKMIFIVLPLLMTSIVANAEHIVINEIMYNSTEADDVEYIELYNRSDSEIDMSGWYVLDDNDDHSPCNLEGILGAGEYIVIAGDYSDFTNKYPDVMNLNSNVFNQNNTGWSLGNGDDVVRLFDASGVLHDSVAYQDGGDWPGSPDGNGPSLELLNPFMYNGLPTSWDPGLTDGGTPGKQNSVYTEDVKPVCKNGSRNVDLPQSDDQVKVTVYAYDFEGLAHVELFIDFGDGFKTSAMNDDGVNGDEAAGDSVYTVVLPAYPHGTCVKYYAVATDNMGQSDSWPNDAPEKFHAFTVNYTPPALFITEVLASNKTGLVDEFGENDDWFELYNADDFSVNLEGMYVSDALNSSKMFELPSIVLDPGEYVVIWADNDEEQGTLHANFKLSTDGESIALFETIEHGNVLVHGWKFGLMSPDVSMGIVGANENAPEYLVSPTPGSDNSTSDLFSPVCINEFQCTSYFGGVDDWVEIYNRGSEPYDLSGCFISDERHNNTKWSFPEGTVLNPGDFLVVYEDVLKFGFSSEGDDVIMLTAADSSTGLDFYDFGVQSPDISEGRFPDGSSHRQYFDTPTKGEANITLTDVVNEIQSVPNEYTLWQNYPNPFNPSTTISFSLPSTSQVSLKIYNMIGQLMITLVDEQLSQGYHEFQWQAANLPSGIYYYTLRSGSFSQTKRMILLK